MAIVAVPSLAVAEAPRFATFTFENDLFAGYDRHYTNGVQLATLADLELAPDWVKSRSADRQGVLAIGQRIYTPANTDVKAPEPGDRPYGGWLYVMADIRERTAPTIDHLTMTIGVIGPASGARQTQNGVHHLLGESRAEGWDTQVRPRPTVMVGYERAWPSVFRGAFARHEVDLSLRASANAGTPLTYANTGAILRFGSALPNDLPVTHLSLGPPRDGYRGASQFGWYVWAGLDAHAVAYNSFIQASTFIDRPHAQRENTGHDVQAGAALAWPRARIGCTFVQRSHEYKGQSGDDRYGQVTVSWAY